MMLLDSFRIPGKVFGLMMLYDILQLVATSLISISFFTLFAAIYAPVTGIVPDATEISAYLAEKGELPPLTSELETKMNEHIGLIQGFFIRLTVMIACALALLSLNSSLFRSLVYATLRRVRYTRKYFLAYLKANTLWHISWFLLAAVVIAALRLSVAAYVVVALLVMYAHATPIVRSRLREKETVREAFAPLWSIAILRIYRFIIPAAIIILAFRIIFIIPNLEMVLPRGIVMGLFLIGLFLAASWARNYYALAGDAA